MLAEMAAALMVILIVMGVTVQVLGLVAAERRAVERRAWAIEEVQNVLERLSVLPADQLTPEAIAALKLGERTEQALPGGKLDVTVHDGAGEHAATRLTVAIRWRDRSGALVAPVLLTTWVEPFRKEAR